MLDESEYYRELCEAVRHYSNQMNSTRRLLVTQSFVWLTGLGFAASSLAGWSGVVATGAITLFASFATLALGHLHAHYFSFVKALLQHNLARSSASPDDPWQLVEKTAQQEFAKGHNAFMKPHRIPIIIYCCAAVLAVLLQLTKAA